MKKTVLYKLLKNLFLFVSIVFVLDRAIGYTLKKMYFKGQKGDFYQTTYAITNAKEQVLILGSSRAAHHYVSSILQNNMQLSTYNLGRDGRNIAYAYTVFSQLLTYHHPKIVILDMQPEEFVWNETRQSEEATVSALLPYINYPAIDQIISRNNRTDIILSKIFWTYPYNSIALQIIGNRYNLLAGEETIQGFIPLAGSKRSKGKAALDINHPKRKPTDTALVNTFKDFLALARNKHVDLHVVISPTSVFSPYNSISQIKQLTQQSGFRFYNYSTSVKDYSLFYDETHLNIKGATQFTTSLAKELQNNTEDRFKLATVK